MIQRTVMSKFALSLLFFSTANGIQPEGDPLESNAVNVILQEMQVKRLQGSSLTYSSERIVRWGDDDKPESIHLLCVHEEIISVGRIHARSECEERRYVGNKLTEQASRNTTIRDGFDQYYWQENGDVVIKANGRGGGVDDEVIDDCRKNFELRVVHSNNKNVPGSNVVLEGDAKQAEDEVKSVQIEFGHRGLLLRRSKYDSDGHAVFDFVVSNVKYEAPVDPQRVEFSLPKGMTLKESQPGKGQAITIKGKLEKIE